MSDTAGFFQRIVRLARGLCLRPPRGYPSLPLASPGAMIKLHPSGNWTLPTAVFAGKPAGMDTADPQRHDGHGFGAFKLAGRPFVIAEANRKARDAATIKLGGWLHFNRFGLLDAASRNVIPNWSVYGIADWRVAGATDAK